MKRTQLSTALTGVLLLSSSFSASAIQIVLDYSYDTNNFFGSQVRKDILQTAVNSLGSRLSDNLLAIESSGGNTFEAKFSNPADGVTATKSSYSVVADTMVIFVGGRDLGTTTLGQGGFGGYSASATTQVFLDTVAARGQTGALDATPTDFGPWGGSISFNTSSNWYFDSDVSTTESFTGNDFYSVALHEMGHVLGLGTAASWNSLIVGSNVVGTEMGTVALADAGHFANGTLSTVNGVSQETVMSASITTGTRKVFTDLDYAALSDVGLQVTPVPVPAAVWLFASGLIGLFATARRKA